jgi:anti-sigma-K factor RskA
MTDHDETSGWNDVHALSGAYAVDALDELERARFEEHLRRCPDCRAEVEDLQETAATLAHESVDLPAGLRASVLEGIESIRPIPPLTEVGRPEVAPLTTRRRLRLLRTPVLVAAAAVLLVALGGALWLRPWAGDDPQVGQTATERVLAAADAERYSQRLDDGSRATVVVSRSEGAAVILTEDMADAPAGKDYQLWLQTPQDEMVPAGLMPDQEDATVLLEGDASRAVGVGITVEPDGGSPEPTTEPVLLFDLTA